MKEWLRRALRTFIQAAIGFIATNLVIYVAGVDFSNLNAAKTVFIGLVASAVAAGIAAVMNLEPPKVEEKPGEIGEGGGGKNLEDIEEPEEEPNREEGE